MESLACKNEAAAWYLSQNRRFRGVAIFNENGCETESQNDVKIDLVALGGVIFDILDDFLRGPIFDEFSIGEKSVQNVKKVDLERTGVEIGANNGRGRRQRL